MSLQRRCSDVDSVRVPGEHEETFPRAKVRSGIDIRPPRRDDVPLWLQSKLAEFVGDERGKSLLVRQDRVDANEDAQDAHEVGHIDRERI